ncbi:hypothetical protein NYO98_09955 [Nocardioides sp. STR2]|uniref:Polysaccharide biosynthesis protein C-terminal domain-containing protein n=1 Tax=Nocardioides pini TaxID=2975053 RepID=A0ABT4CCC2_9ACTN|nr:hypothetical protein [Nocardioides pini]MCY4726600.1 hypothetical protein [Nocardioides pini]
MIATSYTTALLPLLQIAAPSAAPGFAVAQRLLSYANLATISLSNAFMGAKSHQRAKNIVVMLTWSAASSVVFALIAPVLSELILGTALPSPWSALLLAATYLGVAINTCISRLWLIPHGQVKSVVAATAIGSALGLPSALILAMRFGADGGLAGTLVAETACCVALIIMTVRGRGARRG